MLEEAYSYGLTPKEATELTLAEMASFIKGNRKAEMRRTEILARIGYSAGMIGSMSLAQRKPRFEEVFKFPRDKQQNSNDMKNAMLAWAEAVNRNERRQKSNERRN